jgi:parvulin-like peptidyl-prolyl isomerase
MIPINNGEMHMRTYRIIVILLAVIMMSFLLSCSKFGGESKDNPLIARYGDSKLTKDDMVSFIRYRYWMDGAKVSLNKEEQIRIAKDFILQSYYVEEARRNKFKITNLDKLVETNFRPVLIRSLIREKMDAHPNDFRITETVKVRHLFMEVPPEATSTQKKTIRQRIESLRKKVLAGEDFAQLASTYSEVKSKEQGGDIGYIQRGQLKIKPFEDMAFSIETGKISPVVETIYGYHILRVEDKTPESIRPYAEVVKRGLLKELLLDQERRQVQSKLAEEVLSRTSIERHYEVLDLLGNSTVNSIVFKVGRKPFTLADFREAFGKDNQYNFKKNTSMELKNEIASKMENLIQDEALYQECLNIHYHQKPEMVKAKQYIEKHLLSALYQESLKFRNIKF